MFDRLDTVALTVDLPPFGLKAGDVGAIVEILGSDVYEVEFVAPSGRMQALVELETKQIRVLGDRDVLAVRARARHAA